MGKQMLNMTGGLIETGRQAGGMGVYFGVFKKNYFQRWTFIMTR